MFNFFSFPVFDFLRDAIMDYEHHYNVKIGKVNGFMIMEA